MEGYLTDLEEVVLAVRDRSAKTLLQDAVACYRTGATRSAISATWLAVVVDIYSKIRELAGRGDKQANGFVKQLDAAVTANNVQALQAIESAVLNTASEGFQFIGPHALRDLRRLEEDRHRCVHPALLEDGLLYAPSAESARAHIVHAGRHLLQNEPTQGKYLIDDFKVLVLQPSFPTDETDVQKLIEELLSRARDSVRLQVPKLCIKVFINRDVQEASGKEGNFLLALRAARALYHSIYLQAMTETVPRVCEGADDGTLVRLLHLIAEDTAVWDLVGTGTQTRLQNLCSHYLRKEHLDGLNRLLQFEPLSQHLQQSIDELDTGDRARVIARIASPKLTQQAIKLIEDAGTWREGESAFWALEALAQHLDTDQLDRGLRAVAKNSEVREASGTVGKMTDFYAATRHLLPESGGSWTWFLGEVRRLQQTGTNYYRYPDLETAMKNDGLEPDPPDETEDSDSI